LTHTISIIRDIRWPKERVDIL